MKSRINGLIFSGIVMSVLAVATTALAAEGTVPDWRPTYDLAMRWVNFLILAFLLYKFLKKPIVEFLSGQKEKVAREIRLIEEEKQAAETKIKETLELVEEAESRFDDMRRRIVDEGAVIRDRMIEDAKSHSEVMIRDAQQRAEHMYTHARDRFRAELVDAAIEIALKKIPGEITEEDNERFVANFMSGVAAGK